MLPTPNMFPTNMFPTNMLSTNMIPTPNMFQTNMLPTPNMFQTNMLQSPNMFKTNMLQSPNMFQTNMLPTQNMLQTNMLPTQNMFPALNMSQFSSFPETSVSRKRKHQNYESGSGGDVNPASKFAYPYPYKMSELEDAKRTLKEIFFESTPMDDEYIDATLKSKLGMYPRSRVAPFNIGWGEAATNFCEANLQSEVGCSFSGINETPDKRRKIVHYCTETETSSAKPATVGSQSIGHETIAVGPSMGSETVVAGPSQHSETIVAGLTQHSETIVAGLSTADDSGVVVDKSGIWEDEDAYIIENNEWNNNCSVDDEQSSVVSDQQNDSLYSEDGSPHHDTANGERNALQVSVTVDGEKKGTVAEIPGGSVGPATGNHSTVQVRPPRSYSCDYCPIQFDNLSDLERHLAEKRHYSGSLISLKVGLDGKHIPHTCVTPNVAIHKESQYQTFIPVCPDCKLGFPSIRQCANHFSTHCHEDGELIGPGSYALARVCHVTRSTIKLRPYTCPFCRETFQKSTEMKEHVRDHEEKIDNYKWYYVCEHCNIPFQFNSLLAHQVHIRHCKDSIAVQILYTNSVKDSDVCTPPPLENMVHTLNFEIETRKQMKMNTGKQGRRFLRGQITQLKNILKASNS